MPKKFANENSKAVAAKDRKNEKAAQEKSAKQKKADDEYWADDDKGLGKYSIATLAYINTGIYIVHFDYSPPPLLRFIFFPRRQGWCRPFHPFLV